ncbi:MAG: L-2-amino-thiazoline-4-carboxylic acid hydrolase [Methanomassiliicoccales archaeon]|nr:L-2-amino-thiazoline-4-carboxylic acid hydrolase [Methanomassiliicoccales archaeon]
MEKAVDALKREWEHIGSAIPLNIIRKMGLAEKGFIVAGYSLNWADRLWGCDQRSEVTIYGIRSRVDSCRYSIGSSALCKAHLRFAATKICTSLAPEHTFVSRSCLNGGDDHCEMLMVAESKSAEELMSAPAIASILPPPLDEGESILWSHSYFSTGWITQIKAMIEVLGPDATLERLKPIMHQIGEEAAPRIEKELGVQGDNLRSVAEGIDTLNSTFLKEGTLTNRTDLSIERRTTTCPLSGEPGEVCSAFLSFYEGLVKGLNPSFEFDCSQRMSEGGEYCQWVLHDTRQHAKKQGDDSTSTDPFAYLSFKYINGEISDEEYERKMAMLKRHFPRG